ncbi:MAG: PAS domain-containing sensor histidine kinase [Arenimonas sp.]|nr:PAS domain-containing sensor histidine kinase [Arenimonas sp.]
MSAIDTAVFDHLATPILWLDGQARVRDCNAAFSGWLSVGKRRLQGVEIDVLDREAPRLRDLCGQCRLSEERMQALRLQLGFAGVKDRFADAIVVREAEGWRIEWHPRAEFEGEDPALALPAALSVAFKGLAHELRNPLAGLKGAAQLLQKKLADQSGTLPLARLIENEVDRLTQLIDQFMHPAPPKAHVPVNIHGVLETVRQLADAEAGWSVKLVRDYDPSLPEVMGDADRLTQAVLNLVRNALQSGAGQVVLRTRAEHQVLIADQLSRLAIRVEIADDGRGVPDDLQENIFLPLVSGRAEGTGLGLPLAMQIAREHGGSLGFRSRPGHTVFTLLLPAPEETA